MYDVFIIEKIREDEERRRRESERPRAELPIPEMTPEDVDSQYGPRSDEVERGVFIINDFEESF